MSVFYKSKLIALGFLVIALIGVKGRKDEMQDCKTALLYLLVGLRFFWLSGLALLIPGKLTLIASLYMGMTGLGSCSS